MNGPRFARAALHLGGVIGLLSICACANQGSPAGGPQDRSGPQVVGTFPEPFAIVAAFDDEIRVEFNERISERGRQGSLDDAVVISPESGEISVRHSSRALRVTMEGGFRPDEVYRVTIQPTVQDLFQNAMVGAFEFIFSTGPEMSPTVLAGSIVDRITDQPIAGARVMARAVRPEGEGEADDTVIPAHIATTDAQGVYAFRYVPVGRYDLTAFVDENRNREHNDSEPVGIAQELLNAADTIFLDFALLAPDTTPALAGSVDAVDSLTLSVGFDDFLDPDSELVGVSASLGPDSLPAIEILAIMHERDYRARQDVIQDSLHVSDSIQFEEDQQQIELLTSAGDSAAAAEIQSQLTSPRPPAQIDPRESQTRDLPTQVLFFLLSDTLYVDRSYELTVSGVTNINGVPGGGGTAEVLREEVSADPPPNGPPPGTDPTRPPGALTPGGAGGAPNPGGLPGPNPGLQPSSSHE